MFPSLFITALPSPSQKKKCGNLSIEDRLKEIWCLHIMEQYKLIKKDNKDPNSLIRKEAHDM